MKKITLILILISVYLQSSFAYWTNLQNTGTPTSSYYLGDKLQYIIYFEINSDTFGWPNPQYGLGKTTDGTSWSWFNATYHSNNGTNWIWKSNANEMQFTSIGNWYYSGKITDNSAHTEYASAGWAENRTTLSASSYFTVSALSDPTLQTATEVSNTQIDLSWTKWNSKNVMIVRRLTAAAESDAPVQGSAYTVGSTLGTGTVVYNSGGISFNDTGLTPGTSYTYIFYSENFSYYSEGSTANATTTAVSASTDYYRSKTTGNWNTAGSWESSDNGSSNWVSATLVPGSSANAITILNGHNITLDANVYVSGLTINSGGTFTASDASPRTLTILKSASGSSTTLANSGTWANGTGGSTVVFTGAPSSANAVHAISGIIVFQNLTVNKTTEESYDVGASFGVNSSLTGTLEIGSGGYISTIPPGGFYGTGSILKFNQGAPAIYDVNPGDKTWSASVIPNNITVSSGKVRLNENRLATGDLIISSGATLEISSAIQLTVNTSLTNNGVLTLKNAATVITNGTVLGGGTTNVEQTLTAGRNWWYLASPVTNAQTSIFNTNNNKIGYFNEPTALYTNPITSAETLTVGKGYVVKLNSDLGGTYTFTGGSLNTGTITLSPTRTGTTAGQRGFNLVGNPYPSYLDWDAAYTDENNPATNLRDAIWYRTFASGMVFHTYADGDGVPATTTGKIPPMQGYWIKVKNDGSNGSITFNNIHRSHAGETANPLKAKAVSNKQRLRLVLSNGTNTDETLIVGKSYASDNIDAYDIEKMSNDNVDIPEIFSLVNNEELVINSISQLSAGKEIVLGLRPGIAGNFSISATQFENIPSDVRVYLSDNFTTPATETELSEGVNYNFTSESNATNNRFSILFRSAGSITDCENVNAGKIYTVCNNNRLTIISNQNLKDNASVDIYNQAGQKVATQKIVESTTTINQNLTPGIYFITMYNGQEIIRQKLIFK